MKDFTVSIPCKTYIRKYFTGLYGAPIQLDNSTVFGDVILTKLHHKPVKLKPKKELNISSKHYDDAIIFRLSIDHFYRVENQINEQHHFFINRFLENTFVADLYQVVCIAGCFGIEKKHASHIFVNQYKIILEEDISEDAIKKMYSRYAKKPTTEHYFLKNLATPFSNLKLTG